MEGTLELEATEVEAEWINPYGAGIKSKEKGVSGNDAPVSNTIGSIRAGSRFGWRVGTELEGEVAVVAKELTVTIGALVVMTTEVVGVGRTSLVVEANR